MTASVQDVCFIGSSRDQPAAEPRDRDRGAIPTPKCSSPAKPASARTSWRGSSTGTARAAARRSPRSTAPGLPDSLLESELFGHVRGSFTGAFRDKAGPARGGRSRHGVPGRSGRDEPRMQGMLLRFLETGEVQRVGSERTARHVNVRIIAATNRDLMQQIGAGAFREDLYYRLNVIRIHVASAARAPGRHPGAVRVLLRAVRRAVPVWRRAR